MHDNLLETSNESSRWHARDVTYSSGQWETVKQQIPEFVTGGFKADVDGPSNPHMKVVIRLPLIQSEQPIPVGTVSNNYTLAQHRDVADKCFRGIRESGIDTDGLRCDLGLTALGEWMNLRIYFPETFNQCPEDGEELALRLECFNSVDGSSRLVIFLGWLRFVCSNGMVIGETKTELRAIHNKHMDISQIPALICDSLTHVQDDLSKITSWEKMSLPVHAFEPWINKVLPDRWNKQSSCRVFHICHSGEDVEFEPPFVKCEVMQKSVKVIGTVPGARAPASNLYDVSQALSWVASSRTNPEERVKWQSQIPKLIEQLKP